MKSHELRYKLGDAREHLMVLTHYVADREQNSYLPKHEQMAARKALDRCEAIKTLLDAIEAEVEA